MEWDSIYLMSYMGIFVIGMYVGFFVGIITVGLFKKEFSDTEEEDDE